MSFLSLTSHPGVGQLLLEHGVWQDLLADAMIILHAINVLLAIVHLLVLILAVPATG
jgi:hypothetical protein